MPIRCIKRMWLAWLIIYVHGHVELVQADDDSALLTRFINKHCASCHDTDTKQNGLDLTSLPRRFDDPKHANHWIDAFDRVKRGNMPPEDADQPSLQERAEFQAALDRLLFWPSRARQASEGRVGKRRLNRVEWEKHVQAVLRISAPLAGMLPDETPMHGFDTVAEGLRFSPLHLEKYLEAADAALNAAINLQPKPTYLRKRYSLKDEKGVRENLDFPDGKIKDPISKEKHRVIMKELPNAVVLFSDGYSPTDLKQMHLPATATYRISVSAYAYQSQQKPVMLRLYASDYRTKRLLGQFEVQADVPRVVTLESPLQQNDHLIVIPYGTGFDEAGKSVWEIGAPSYQGVGLAVEWIEVEGPLEKTWPPPSLTNLFGDESLKEHKQHRWVRDHFEAYTIEPKNPHADAEAIVRKIYQQAMRRPTKPADADPYVRSAHHALDQKQPYVAAVRQAIRAIFTSPEFLFVDDATQPANADKRSATLASVIAEPVERASELMPLDRLDQHSVAHRLSLLLWSAPPDGQLRKLADVGTLLPTSSSKPAGFVDAKEKPATELARQVDRMIDDPRFQQGLIEHFVGQWLDLRRINATTPDKQLYPEFDEILERSMVLETRAFINELIKQNHPVWYLADSLFVVIDRILAKHYELEDAFEKTVSNNLPGEVFRPVPLPEHHVRGGVLTQAAILKVTANGTVSSPVLRGAWVMKRLLGQPPPPPPPNVGSVEPDTRGAATIRELLDKHRKLDACAGCHRQIDPPGFALESFDVIGGFRDRYRSIGKGDQSAKKYRNRGIWEYRLGPKVDASGTFAGQEFADVKQFKALLCAQKETLAHAFIEHLLTYATGAGHQYADRLTIQQIKATGMRDIIHAIVHSEAFLSR